MNAQVFPKDVLAAVGWQQLPIVLAVWEDGRAIRVQVEHERSGRVLAGCLQNIQSILCCKLGSKDGLEEEPSLTAEILIPSLDVPEERGVRLGVSPQLSGVIPSQNGQRVQRRSLVQMGRTR